MNFFRIGSSGRFSSVNLPGGQIDAEDLAHVAAGEGGGVVVAGNRFIVGSVSYLSKDDG